MSDSFFCPIRKTEVLLLPEERVRQVLIQDMIQNLGYPIENIVLEKTLAKLPHLQGHLSLPKRRTDLIVFAQGIHKEHPFYPLLLVECKAVPLTEEVLRQIVGYNQYVGAPFVTVVNQTKRYTGWYHSKECDFLFQEGLPTYNSLLSNVT